MKPIFRAHDIVSVRGDRTVLKGLSLQLGRGEVLGVFGTFDSGKSTLLDIVEMVIEPWSGALFFENVRLFPPDGAAPARPVIERIGRETTLARSFSLWENIFLTRRSGGRMRFVNPVTMKRAAAQLLREYGLDLDPGLKAGRLSRFQCFLVELLRAHYLRARIILVDDFNLECTADEYVVLKDLMRRFQDEGISFLFTSCRISLLLRVADRIAFLYDGRIAKIIENKPVHAGEIDRMLEAMIAGGSYHDRRPHSGAVALSIRGLEAGLREPLELDLREGEIVSVIDPSKTVLDAIRAGLNSGGGAVSLAGGRRRKFKLDRQLRSCHIALLDHEVFGSLNEGMSVADNLCMGVHKKLSTLGVIRVGLLRYVMGEFDGWYRQKRLSARENCRGLQTRDRIALILFRLKLINPKVVICRNPTSDTDLITHDMLKKCLAELAEAGAAVCVLNSNIERMDDFADRYYIISGGRLHEAQRDEISRLLEWG